jgi:hypothetical protein
MFVNGISNGIKKDITRVVRGGGLIDQILKNSENYCHLGNFYFSPEGNVKSEVANALTKN